MDQFVVFGLARTGSTTLTRLLNLHPQIRCLEEPFNRDYHPEYALRATDRESIYTILDEIYQIHNGIKHVADPDEWPFGNVELNYDLLDYSGCKFILLRRLNILKRLVSQEIADQTGIWHFWEESDRDTMRQATLRALNISKLRSRLTEEGPFIAECRRRLKSSGKQYYELTYESLFGSRITRHEQLAVVDDVVAFLELPSFDADKRYGEVSELLEVSNTGSGAQDMYRRILNIDEIENELGHDGTGWLFK